MKIVKGIWEWVVVRRPARWVAESVNALFFPIATVWYRERPMLLLFCSANLLVAQIGVLASFWFAAERGVAFGRALYQNLQNASFYIFAVSLLVTTMSILVAEYLEVDDARPRIELRGHKVGWGILAGLLVLFQVAFTGSLISESMRTDSGPTVIQAPGTQQGQPTPELTRDAAPLKEAASFEVSKVLTSWGGANQVLLWLLSMFVAVHMFCLSRMHKHPEEMHQMRERQIARATLRAEKMHLTSDDVKV